MGLFIHLTVNFNNIKSEEWNEVYRESLHLLHKFPAPLMRLKVEEINSRKRFAFTEDIIVTANTEDEHWEIIGDLKSYKRAESFVLYKHLEKYTSRVVENNDNDKDVLWSNEDSIDYCDCNGLELFGNKTQGYPYHLALLSVAILFENRFPQKAFLLGDVDETQIKSMISWMNKVLDRPVMMPVCINGSNLWSRLNFVYDDKSLAIKRFTTLFRGTNRESFETLLKNVDRHIILKKFINDLTGYSSLSQFGAKTLVMTFLSVTKDLRTLIDIINKIRTSEKKEKFALEELLRILCGLYITIDFSERTPLSAFTMSGDQLTNMESLFGHLMMKLGGVPSDIDIFMESSEILDIFSFYNEEKRESFSRIIEENEMKCREELDTIRSILNNHENESEEKSAKKETDMMESTITNAQEADSVSGEEAMHEEIYIIDQVEHQKKRYKNPEISSSNIGKSIQRIIRKHTAIFDSMEREYYLENIYQASEESGFALRESAWAEIDAEEDPDVLKSILALSLINDNEMNFWHWRIYILEHKELWTYLCHPIEDEISSSE